MLEKYVIGASAIAKDGVVHIKSKGYSESMEIINKITEEKNKK